MKGSIAGLFREPLAHFLLIGAVLFGYYSVVNDIQAEVPKSIVVEPAQVKQIVSGFQRMWSRPPTADELDALIENHVREEVFYREALAMGLDRNDPLVRKRMRQKLEFMLEDLSEASIVEADIERYFAQNQEVYEVSAKLSFHQVFLNSDRHDDLEAKALQLLEDLRSGIAAESLGDRSLIPVNYELVTRARITRDFGPDFSRAIFELVPGDWQGPVYSAFGVHLVRISERTEARIPALVEVEDRVRRDFLVQRQKEQKDLAYQRLREDYSVTINSATEESL